MKNINLVYIGDDFYWESGTAMSSIYTEDWKRSDWGKVQVALRDGASIFIRPATDAEMGIAYRMLREIKERKEL
jgi:hypothetical protein